MILAVSLLRKVGFALGWFFIVGPVIRDIVDRVSTEPRLAIDTANFPYMLLSVSFGVWFLWLVDRSFILNDDSVELVSWFSRRRWGKDEIRGRRVVTRYRSQRQVLFSKDDAQAPMALPPQLHADKYFHEFAKSIPII